MYDLYAMQTKYVPLADRRFVDLWGGNFGWWVLATGNHYLR
jgi:hypothetical protein